MSSETIVQLYAAHPKTYDPGLLVLVQEITGGPGTTGAIPITDIFALDSQRVGFGDVSGGLIGSTQFIFDNNVACLSISKGSAAATDSTAILKLESTDSFLYLTAPTTAERTAVTPSREGAITWDSDLNRLVVWSGGGWDVFQGMAYQDPSSVSILGGTATFSSLTIGSLDNTPIGATTPSTGAFTTLTAGIATISGGALDDVSVGGGIPGPGYFNLFTCNKRAFANMDWGLATISSPVGQGTITSQTISLTAAFTGAPHVVCTASMGATANNLIGAVSVGVYNVSTSSFEVNLTIQDPAYSGVSLTPVYVSWFAFE